MTFTWRKTVAADLDEAEELIALRRPFRLRRQMPPTLWATGSAPTHLGLLPPQYSEGIEQAVYVVMSYGTPIAWELEDGEIVVPDVGYSPATGQHQYLAAHALGVPFRPGRGRPVVQPPRYDSQHGRARRLRRGGIDGTPDAPLSAAGFDRATAAYEGDQRPVLSQRPVGPLPPEYQTLEEQISADDFAESIPPGAPELNLDTELSPAPPAPGWHSTAHP